MVRPGRYSFLPKLMCPCSTVMVANSLGVLFSWMYMEGKIGFLFVPYVGAISLCKVKL